MLFPELIVLSSSTPYSLHLAKLFIFYFISRKKYLFKTIKGIINFRRRKHANASNATNTDKTEVSFHTLLLY